MAFPWTLDESKYLELREVRKLRKSCQKLKRQGNPGDSFVPTRNWFMVELGLFTGLRVEEMANLSCGDLFLQNAQSSLIVRCGKGNKKRVA